MGFWAGVQHGREFLVSSAYVPRQLAGEMDGGCLVMVDGEQLFQMNVWLHANHLTLVAQLHSHPTDAYHSVTDDDFAVMTRTGGLSIVVPDYAVNAFSLTSAAIYRLQPVGSWTELSAVEAGVLIQIIES